jgi:hypothetical protein
MDQKDLFRGIIYSSETHRRRWEKGIRCKTGAVPPLYAGMKSLIEAKLQSSTGAFREGRESKQIREPGNLTQPLDNPVFLETRKTGNLVQ